MCVCFGCVYLPKVLFPSTQGVSQSASAPVSGQGGRLGGIEHLACLNQLNARSSYHSAGVVSCRKAQPAVAGRLQHPKMPAELRLDRRPLCFARGRLLVRQVHHLIVPQKCNVTPKHFVQIVVKAAVCGRGCGTQCQHPKMWARETTSTFAYTTSEPVRTIHVVKAGGLVSTRGMKQRQGRIAECKLHCVAGMGPIARQSA